MNPYEKKVRFFHEALGLANDAELSPALLDLRKKLLLEEMKELEQEIDNSIAELAQKGAVSKKTKANLLKEMADVQYVLSGMAATFGLPLEEAFDRVHESNLSKFDDEGKPIRREDGKILKGPNYYPPFLEDLV
jgi:predicted HAD superfamily Cof-like phosphohydrolase